MIRNCSNELMTVTGKQSNLFLKVVLVVGWVNAIQSIFSSHCNFCSLFLSAQILFLLV